MFWQIFSCINISFWWKIGLFSRNLRKTIQFCAETMCIKRGHLGHMASTDFSNFPLSWAKCVFFTLNSTRYQVNHCRDYVLINIFLQKPSQFDGKRGVSAKSSRNIWFLMTWFLQISADFCRFLQISADFPYFPRKLCVFHAEFYQGSSKSL